MLRVSQCCCGCSLRTGTLILLWLDLISQASNVFKLAVAACSSEYRFTFFDSGMLGWASFVLVIGIYAIVGVEKHRPSYLLPYIGSYIFALVCLIFLTMFLWVGSLTMRDQIIDVLSRRIPISTHSDESINPDDVRRVYNDVISVVTFFLIFCIALSFYFFSVIYSYYKQMQEEDRGIYNQPAGTGVVYATPAEQTKGYDCPPAYGQQPAAAPYPQQNTGYPQPVVGYPQPVAGYPNLPQNVGYPQQQYPDYPQKQ